MANNEKRQTMPEDKVWLKQKYGAVLPKLGLLADQQKVCFPSRPMQRSDDT